MLCTNCKSKEANVHYKQVINGQQKEYHLCNECASKLNFSFDKMFPGFLTGFDDFFGGLGQSRELENKTAGRVCQSCGLDFDDFRANGRIGCANCYDAFSKELDLILKNVQAGNRHIVEKEQEEPQAQKSELEILKEKLKEAISKEEFELAAQLRDKIRSFENDEG